jgi:hypothetical protein
MTLDLNIKKINDNVYRICDKNNKLFTILIPSINAPFGIENNYLNLEINMTKSHHSQLLGDLYKLDNYLKSFIENIDPNIIWKSSLKKRENWHNMLKTQLAKKGLECYKENCNSHKRGRKPSQTGLQSDENILTQTSSTGSSGNSGSSGSSGSSGNSGSSGSASHISIYDINIKNDCSIELVLQSMWVRNNFAGIIWEIKKIKELVN